MKSFEKSWGTFVHEGETIETVIVNHCAGKQQQQRFTAWKNGRDGEYGKGANTTGGARSKNVKENIDREILGGILRQ